MHSAIRRFGILAALFAIAPLARAADAPTAISGAEQSAFLKPYITQDTLLVAHVDVGLIDTAAVEKFIVDTVSTVAMDDPNIPQEIGQTRMIADAFLARFKQTGGRQVYLVISQKGEEEPQPPIVLFPLEAGGDAKGLMALLSSIPKMQAVQISDHLVALGAPAPGAAETAPADRPPSDLPEKLKALVAADRPEFDKALGQGKGALQIVMSPGQSARDAITKNVPTFPPTFGGGSTDILAKNFQYALISITPPPTPEVHVTFQSDSPENAKASLDLINSYFKFIASVSPMHDLGTIMAPQVNGNAVEMILDGKKIQSAVASVIPEVFAGRRRAQMVASAANMRQDIMGAMMYANDNNDNWPTDLQTIVDKGYLPNDKTLKNPNDPKNRPYEYHPFTKDEMKKLDAAFTPVIWETADDDAAAINVGYLDGHVEKLANKAELTKQLDAAKEKLKAP